LTSEQIVARLSENEDLAGAVKEMPREGTLLPETYKFPRGNHARTGDPAHAADAKRVLAEIWSAAIRTFPIKTPEQLVTLASIVEKETGKADERTPRRRGIRQSVAARIKLRPIRPSSWAVRQGNAGAADQAQRNQQPSPYNTYVVDGLPPGRSPIPARLAGSCRQSGAHARSVLRR